LQLAVGGQLAYGKLLESVKSAEALGQGPLGSPVKGAGGPADTAQDGALGPVPQEARRLQLYEFYCAVLVDRLANVETVLTNYQVQANAN
jgi:hypothetical protein